MEPSKDTGTITDSSGAAIPGAKVAATDLATAAVHETVSSGAGEFSFNDLPLSAYTVKVVCPGFVATDLNDFRGQRTVEQGAKQAVKMALIGPTGTFTDEDGTVPW